MSQHKYPNILFLMTDEHRPDLMGFAGNPIIRTPNLDRLAKDSVIFDNAYTPSPVCIPARQCMMSGQLPKTCGCEVFGNDLPPFTAHLPEPLVKMLITLSVAVNFIIPAGSDAGMAGPNWL